MINVIKFGQKNNNANETVRFKFYTRISFKFQRTICSLRHVNLVTAGVLVTKILVDYVVWLINLECRHQCNVFSLQHQQEIYGCSCLVDNETLYIQNNYLIPTVQPPMKYTNACLGRSYCLAKTISALRIAQRHQICCHLPGALKQNLQNGRSDTPSTRTQ